VGVYPSRPYYVNPPAETSLVMGFTGLNERQIDEGLRRLGQVLRSLMREGERARQSIAAAR